MKTSKFENLFHCVVDAANSKSVQLIGKIAHFMQYEAILPMSVSDLRYALYPHEEEWEKASHGTCIGIAMTKLMIAGFVKCKKIPIGQPITIKREKCVRVDKNGEPIILKVTDEKGRTFEIESPFASDDAHWEIVIEQKTVQPMEKVYTWIGNEG